MNQNELSDSYADETQLLLSGYVLGDLTPEETKQLEQLSTENPDLIKELHALQTSFELLPQGLTQVTPPAHLRARFVVSRTPRHWWKKLLTGAIAIAALLLAVDNLRLRQQLAQPVAPDQVASILQQPNSRLIALTGTETSAAGTLLFTPGNWQEVIVSLGDLPPLPPDQIYRMWLALENGDVIYCGEFNTQTDNSVFVRFTPPTAPPQGVKATELFITVDGRQTSPNPSGDRVMVGPI